ncbi:MAG: hypothetical protein WCC76_04475 [Candidatus Acidiferrales bacterium]|jgi:hypothetical protein
MANGQSGVFVGGAGLVWRRQRVLWWVFIINLVLASLSAHTITGRVAPVLDHSLASIPLLVQGFHLSATSELGGPPEEYLTVGSTPIYYSVIFFFFMLLATGGILEAYWQDSTLSTGEFFKSGGSYFWRFFRLVLFLLLVLIPVGIIAAASRGIGNAIDQKSISPLAWVWFEVGAIFVLTFLLMSVRLWFDMAEVIAVAESETRSRKCLGRGAKIVWHNFGSLFWLYFRISVVGWIVLAAGLHFWVRQVRPASITTSLIISQLIVLFWLGARFWQRASETLWYKNYLSRAETESVAPTPSPYEPSLVASAH